MRNYAALNNTIVTLRLELARETEEHASNIASCRHRLGTLKGQQKQQFKDLRQAIELEASEQIAANQRVDTACTDLRVSLEADRAAQISRQRI